jgi:hypothetical protein
LLSTFYSFGYSFRSQRAECTHVPTNTRSLPGSSRRHSIHVRSKCVPFLRAIQLDLENARVQIIENVFHTTCPHCVAHVRYEKARTCARFGCRFLRSEAVLDRNHLPWNCGARFWTKAEVPSFLSSVPAASAKYFASSFKPEVRSVSTPLFTASMA